MVLRWETWSIPQYGCEQRKRERKRTLQYDDSMRNITNAQNEQKTTIVPLPPCYCILVFWNWMREWEWSEWVGFVFVCVCLCSCSAQRIPHNTNINISYMRFSTFLTCHSFDSCGSRAQIEGRNETNAWRESKRASEHINSVYSSIRNLFLRRIIFLVRFEACTNAWLLTAGHQIDIRVRYFGCLF